MVTKSAHIQEAEQLSEVLVWQGSELAEESGARHLQATAMRLRASRVNALCVLVCDSPEWGEVCVVWVECCMKP